MLPVINKTVVDSYVNYFLGEASNVTSPPVSTPPSSERTQVAPPPPAATTAPTTSSTLSSIGTARFYPNIDPPSYSSLTHRNVSLSPQPPPHGNVTSPEPDVSISSPYLIKVI